MGEYTHLLQSAWPNDVRPNENVWFAIETAVKDISSEEFFVSAYEKRQTIISEQ